MGRAALHLHSTHSDGRVTVATTLDLLEATGTIDVVSFTDHDEIGAWHDALAWKDEHPDSRLSVVWGCEITTRGGKHILSYIFQPPYPKRRFPTFESLDTTVRRLEDAGGVCIVAHPDQWVVGVGLRRLEQQLGSIPILGLETHSPYVRSTERLTNFAREHRLASIGGSDAHFREHLLKWVTEFPGSTPDELLAALHAQETVPVRGVRSPSVPVSELLLQQVQALVVHPSKKVRRALSERAGAN